jgi:hypothetical protein
VAGLLLTVGLHKMLAISCVAMQLLASQEVLSSKQLVKRDGREERVQLNRLCQKGVQIRLAHVVSRPQQQY